MAYCIRAFCIFRVHHSRRLTPAPSSNIDAGYPRAEGGGLPRASHAAGHAAGPHRPPAGWPRQHRNRAYPPRGRPLQVEFGFVQRGQHVALVHHLAGPDVVEKAAGRRRRAATPTSAASPGGGRRCMGPEAWNAGDRAAMTGWQGGGWFNPGSRVASAGPGGRRASSGQNMWPNCLISLVVGFRWLKNPLG